MKHSIHHAPLRIFLLVTVTLVTVALFITIGWNIRPDTEVDRNKYIPRSEVTPAPAVTKTITKIKTVTKTKIVKVPGPERTVIKYVSRSAARAPLTSAPGGVAACIRKFESGSNYSAQNPTSTASGAYQFLDSTWQAVTGLSGRAKDYPSSTQDSAFLKLWDGGRGANQWVTSHRCI